MVASFIPRLPICESRAAWHRAPAASSPSRRGSPPAPGLPARERASIARHAETAPELPRRRPIPRAPRRLLAARPAARALALGRGGPRADLGLVLHRPGAAHLRRDAHLVRHPALGHHRLRGGG